MELLDFRCLTPLELDVSNRVTGKCFHVDEPFHAQVPALNHTVEDFLVRDFVIPCQHFKHKLIALVFLHDSDVISPDDILICIASSEVLWLCHSSDEMRSSTLSHELAELVQACITQSCASVFKELSLVPNLGSISVCG